jgi:multiple sugar transport system ATP-binding protein
VELGGSVFPVSGTAAAVLADKDTPDQEVTVGIRPEDISIMSGDGPSIEGRIEVSELMGSSMHLHITSCGRDCVAIVPASSNLGNGSAVRLTFEPESMHIFGKDERNLALMES